MKIVSAKFQRGICDRSGCNSKAVKYIMLASGAVHLCRKHAAEQTLAAELLLSSNNQASADQPQPAEA
jgi:hypothetical protein